MPFLAPVLATAISSGFITQLLVGTALSIAGTLLSQAMAPPQAGQVDPGVELNLQVGGNSPLTFIVGTTATAGHRVYAGSWGTSGGTPNAYFVDVIELSNAPIDSLAGLYVEKERATIIFAEPHAEFGYPITQGRKGGVDHLWVKFYTGDQTVADPYLVSRFSTHPQRPYGSDMVGRGTAYAIVTQRYERELWQGRTPGLLFEVNGLKLYDLRKDSSAGGSGAHRRNNPSTWEFTRNPYTIAYNVAFMGVYVGTEWMWGLQNLPESRMPRSAWIAAMNESDRITTGWGSKPQFQVGAEISANMQPVDFLDHIARSSLGRFIEVAGSYKPRCGLPGAAVWSFTEGQISISDPRVVTPFPGLEATHNTIQSSYTEPLEAYGTKPAPDAFDAAMIAADGNRELVAGLTFPYVQDNDQAQRLAWSYLRDGRRFRTFQAAFHPVAWLLEPGDIIDGTLVNEGYSDKSFEILEMTGRRTFIQTLTLREVDPADFDPPPSAQQPWTVGPISTIYPVPQDVTGFQAFPDSFEDSDGVLRRPTIRIVYDGSKDDIRAIYVIVRLKSNSSVVFESEIPYSAPYAAKLNGVFLPLTLYEVAIRYVPFTARETNLTAYQDVLTDDIKLIAGKDFDPFETVVGFDELDADISGYLQFVGSNLRETLRQAQELNTKSADDVLQTYTDRQSIRTELHSVQEAVTASYISAITVATGPSSAIVSRIEELEVTVNTSIASAVSVLQTQITTTNTNLGNTNASLDATNNTVADLNTVVMASADAITALDVLVGNNSAGGYFRASVVATEAGASSTIGLSTSASAGGSTAQAALFLSAIGGGLSRVTVDASQFVVRSTTGALSQFLVFDSGGLHLAVADIGTVTAGILRSADSKMIIDLNNKVISIST